MPNEASKLRARWQREGLYERYLVGKKVLDIGCANDKITPDATGWELDTDGNGQLLAGVADGSFDVVFSSHFLEHLSDPLEGLLNQWRVLRSGGYLVFAIPDEDLYEQGVFPPMFNNDHKFTWTIHKDHTWSPAGRNVMDLIRYLPEHKVISMRVVDDGYRYDIDAEGAVVDHTDRYGAEAAIEVIVQKVPPQREAQGAVKKVFRCPKCQNIRFVIRGIDMKDRYTGYCTNCGQTGWFALQT